jgi:hypothetical protein
LSLGHAKGFGVFKNAVGDFFEVQLMTPKWNMMPAMRGQRSSWTLHRPTSVTKCTITSHSLQVRIVNFKFGSAVKDLFHLPVAEQTAWRRRLGLQRSRIKASGINNWPWLRSAAAISVIFPECRRL